jgi:hypothetical protein
MDAGNVGGNLPEFEGCIHFRSCEREQCRELLGRVAGIWPDPGPVQQMGEVQTDGAQQAVSKSNSTAWPPTLRAFPACASPWTTLQEVATSKSASRAAS